MLFILYHRVGLLYLNGAATLPVILHCLGGPGGQLRVYGAPPWQGVSGAAPLKLKIDVKLPCKSIVISSQSGPFIRQMI